jgi:hypothetical protein
MSENYNDTKQVLKEWIKTSWSYLMATKDAFTKETRKFIVEARSDYEKAKKTKDD